VLKRLFIVAVLCTPAAAWAFIKPIRVFAPEWNGVSCINETICTDDISRYQEAVKLYDEALHYVDSSVGVIKNRPHVIFCDSDVCSRSFGLGKRSALTIGRFGIVISPRAWKAYYVRHEMIHHLQSEKLGILKVWRDPRWLTEGMAYSLSEDPRPKLSEPFEQYRAQFNQWYRQVGKEHLWEQASKI
jgi:hypothetical protein